MCELLKHVIFEDVDILMFWLIRHVVGVSLLRCCGSFSGSQGLTCMV